jgi:proline dehydrogenase
MHSSSIIDPSAALQKMKASDLLFANIFLSISRYSYFLLLTSRVMDESFLGSLSRAVCKATAFRYFCGGETLAQSTRRASQLNSCFKYKVILDYSIEESEAEDSWAQNMQTKIQLVKDLAAVNQQANRIVQSIPVKCTSIMSSSLLERLTSMMLVDPSRSDDELIASLSASDVALYKKAIENLTELCQAASTVRVNILLDAEQSYRQAGVELIYRQVAGEVNRPDSSNSSPVLFNTYQMYLKHSKVSVDKHLQHARYHGYIFAAKIVRGAYMVSERQRAQEMGYEDPILATKQAVDECYETVITELIHEISLQENLSTSSSSSCPHIVIASHNRASILQALHLMKDLNLRNSTSEIRFAQILGMSDHLSLALSQAGYNVEKLLCYGPYAQLLPWLVRRFQENQDIFGAMQRDKDLYRSELWRRLSLN